MLTLVVVVQPLAQTCKVVLQRFRVLFKHPVHTQDSSFADLRGQMGQDQQGPDLREASSGRRVGTPEQGTHLRPRVGEQG